MKRVAIYLRVSKSDNSQDTENQLRELRSQCERRDWSIVEIYQDRESGRKGRAERAEFDRMMKDAARGAFDILFCWALDRFSREGALPTMNYLSILDGYGVRFLFLRDEILNTDHEMFRPIVIALMATFANLEAKRISERTKAGLATARSKGKELGRPSARKLYRNQVKAMLDEDPFLSYEDIVTRLAGKISERTARRIVDEIRNPSNPTP